MVFSSLTSSSSSAVRSMSGLVSSSSAGMIRHFSGTARAQLSRISLVGHLGTAPEIKTSSKGNESVRYSLATTHGPATNRQTDWFKVLANDAPGPSRDRIMNMQKGSLLYVEGDLRQFKYQDEQTGRTHTGIQVIQRFVLVLKRRQPNPDRKGEEGSSQSSDAEQAFANESEGAPEDQVAIENARLS